MSVRLVLTAIGTAFVMFTFEVTKQLFSPHIAIWTSHTITILFTSFVATVAAYVMGKKLSSTNTELGGTEPSSGRARLRKQTGDLPLKVARSPLSAKWVTWLQTCADP